MLHMCAGPMAHALVHLNFCFDTHAARIRLMLKNNTLNINTVTNTYRV